MTEQQKEIETVKPRVYRLNLSDADVKRIAKTAGAYGLTVSELLENFIGDLVAGTYSNGSDERMYADQWAERCWFSLDPEKSLVQYLCSEAWEFDFSDLMNVFERIDDIKSNIEIAEKNIAEPDNKWQNLFYHKYNNDRTSYECVPCYNSVEEFVASENQDLISYKEELENVLEKLNDYQNSFDKYMDGKEYLWEEEVTKATAWYKENISDKLSSTSAKESGK